MSGPRTAKESRSRSGRVFAMTRVTGTEPERPCGWACSLRLCGLLIDHASSKPARSRARAPRFVGSVATQSWRVQQPGLGRHAQRDVSAEPQSTCSSPSGDPHNRKAWHHQQAPLATQICIRIMLPEPASLLPTDNLSEN